MPRQCRRIGRRALPGDKEVRMLIPNATELLLNYLHKYALISARYAAFTGGLYLLFYVWKKRDVSRFKIQPNYPGKKHVIREVCYSFLSLAIVAAMGIAVDILRSNGYTKVYTQISARGWGYFGLSVLLFIVIHDAYFYWTHRIMHWKAIYPYVHRIHHLSTNPTPWAAFSFHPIEALVQAAILPLVAFLVPVHPLAILAWILYQTGMNVMGHLGFEFFPSGFVSGRLTRWHNTSTHHNMHHKYINCNYGLYYNLWDRLMNTNHSRYVEEFEQVKKRAALLARDSPSTAGPPHA